MEHLKKFTDVKIRAIKEPKKITEYREESGLILRVYPSGAKTWIYNYKFEGKPTKMPLGKYPATPIKEAHVNYSAAVLLRDRGVDPYQQEKDEKIKGKTVFQLRDEFITYLESERTRPDIAKQLLNGNISKSVGKTPVADIKTVQLTAMLKKIKDRPAPVAANRTLSVLKQMFNHAVSLGYMERNPLTETKAKSIGGNEVARDRKLSMEEIKALWRFLDSSVHRMHRHTVNAIKLLLLLGVRSGELRTAQWNDINFDDALWTIPKEKTKTRKNPHRVHLSPLAITLLKDMQTSSTFVIPAASGEEPISDKAITRAVSRIQGRIEGIDDQWQPHDLRRTIATHLGDMGVLPHIGEKILGHAMPKIFETYNKHEYLPERADALNMWSDHIESLVNNNNVVSLHG